MRSRSCYQFLCYWSLSSTFQKMWFMVLTMKKIRLFTMVSNFLIYNMKCKQFWHAQTQGPRNSGFIWTHGILEIYIEPLYAYFQTIIDFLKKWLISENHTFASFMDIWTHQIRSIKRTQKHKEPIERLMQKQEKF